MGFPNYSRLFVGEEVTVHNTDIGLNVIRVSGFLFL